MFSVYPLTNSHASHLIWPQKVGSFDVYNIYDLCGNDRFSAAKGGGGDGSDTVVSAADGLSFLERTERELSL